MGSASKNSWAMMNGVLDGSAHSVRMLPRCQVQERFTIRDQFEIFCPVDRHARQVLAGAPMTKIRSLERNVSREQSMLLLAERRTRLYEMYFVNQA
jgi:hypothetical protein